MAQCRPAEQEASPHAASGMKAALKKWRSLSLPRGYYDASIFFCRFLFSFCISSFCFSLVKIIAGASTAAPRTTYSVTTGQSEGAFTAPRPEGQVFTSLLLYLPGRVAGDPWLHGDPRRVVSIRRRLGGRASILLMFPGRSDRCVCVFVCGWVSQNRREQP